MIFILAQCYISIYRYIYINKFLLYVYSSNSVKYYSEEGTKAQKDNPSEVP